MKKFILLTGFLILLTQPAAACYVDYKAKQTNGGLNLHYGVMDVPESQCTAPHAYVTTRLASQGWKLLRVLSTFDAGGLNQRKDNAGDYYLRF